MHPEKLGTGFLLCSRIEVLCVCTERTIFSLRATSMSIREDCMYAVSPIHEG